MDCESCGKSLRNVERMTVSIDTDYGRLATFVICEECYQKIVQVLNAV